MFPELRRHSPKELPRFFMDGHEPEVSEDERDHWLQEVAIQITKTGARGIDFLLSCVPVADETRLRAILLALSMVVKRLSAQKRRTICALALALLDDERPVIVAEAVDTLRSLGCVAAETAVNPLLKHPSPYVVGSALRFFAHHDPEKAVPLLEKALKSPEPIVRQNAVDELDDMNYKPALPKIRRLLQDPDKDVRQAACAAVAHLEEASD
jgi:HEAT repeat protein